MSKKQELSTLTKGLIRKGHGGRKINNDFWYGTLENKPEAPSKKKKKYSLTRKEWTIIVVVCLTMPYIVMHGTDLFEKLILSDEYEVSFTKENVENQEYSRDYTIEEKKYIPPKKQNETTYIPPKKEGYVYVWKEYDDSVYFANNKKSVPKQNIRNLKVIKIDRNRLYCWIDQHGKKVYTNGIPNVIQGKYKLISIK